MALAARAQGVSSAGVEWVGARSAVPHWAAPGDPASATDPGQPALALGQGTAKLGWQASIAALTRASISARRN